MTQHMNKLNAKRETTLVSRHKLGLAIANLT